MPRPTSRVRSGRALAQVCTDRGASNLALSHSPQFSDTITPYLLGEAVLSSIEKGTRSAKRKRTASLGSAGSGDDNETTAASMDLFFRRYFAVHQYKLAQNLKEPSHMSWRMKSQSIGSWALLGAANLGTTAH